MHLVCPSCGTTSRIADERLFEKPVCGRCGTALMATDPANLSDAALPKFIANTELPVLVDFWAACPVRRWRRTSLRRLVRCRRFDVSKLTVTLPLLPVHVTTSAAFPR